MNINNFVTRDDFEVIRDRISNREKFEYQKEYKTKRGKVCVGLKSDYVDVEIARRIWRGNNYLVYFNVSHFGPEFGYGGSGFAMDDFSEFVCWDRFKNWFDMQMKRYGGYEAEEYGQLSLF